MKKYNFKIVTWKGEAGLVELVRDGSVERVTLPMDMLRGATELTESEVDSGIPYGLPYADFLTPSADIVPRLIIALHKVGIWTLDDLRKQPMKVVAALQATYHIETARIIKAAETYLQQEHIQPPVAPKAKPKKEKK